MSVTFYVGIKNQASFRGAECNTSEKSKTEYEKVRVLTRALFFSAGCTDPFTKGETKNGCKRT